MVNGGEVAVHWLKEHDVLVLDGKIGPGDEKDFDPVDMANFRFHHDPEASLRRKIEELREVSLSPRTNQDRKRQLKALLKEHGIKL